MDIKHYQQKIDSFVKDRNWDKFHSPKNLTMALSGEVGELSDILQWLTEEESKRENLNEKTLCLVKEEPITPLVQGYIDTIEGNECKYWNENTFEYFNWHYNHHSE